MSGIKKTILILGLVIFSFSFTGCKFFPKEERVLAPPLKEPPEVTYDKIELQKSTFEKKTECIGYFVSANQKNYCFKYKGGRLKQVYVVPGDNIKKRTLLAELITDNLESQIKQQEIVAQKSEMAYDLAVASEESKLSIKQAELNIKMEELKLEDLQKELAESKLYSAVNGTVDYITDDKQGDYVEAFKTIVRVADLSNIQLEYTGEKVGDFKLGMKAQVKIDDNIFTGKVVMNPENMPLNTDEKMVPLVRIKVNGVPKTVKIGDSAEITLVLIRKENTFVIPKSLTHYYGGRIYVHILENGVKKERDIETGAENQTEVEVIKGLSEGDILINE